MIDYVCLCLYDVILMSFPWDLVFSHMYTGGAVCLKLCHLKDKKVM
jgi:hypothetical protein